MIKSKDCILFSTADWDTPYWTNKQHTARHLAKRGYRVLYIESVGLRTPHLGSRRDLLRLWRRLKRGLRGPGEVETNLWILSPILLPFKQHWFLVRFLNQGLLRWRIGKFLRQRKFLRPIVWTYHPFMLESLPRTLEGPFFYHCVDDLTAIPGIDAKAFNAEENRLLMRTQAVFTTSRVLCDKYKARHPHVHNFPNVADIEHFSQALQPDPLPPEIASIPQPRIGYVGVLSDFKVDFQLVLSVAQQKPDWHWIFIGEEREGQANPLIKQLKSLPNVHFLGFRPYSQLPIYLRGFNVAILPTLINDYTRAMFPMKYFEYLAAGLPVVSTPLDFTRHHQAGLETGEDTLGFIRALERQLQRGKLTLEEVFASVGENTWDKRLDKMLSIVARFS